MVSNSKLLKYLYTNSGHRLFGPLVTFVGIMTLEVLAHTSFKVVAPMAPLMLLITYVTFRSGPRSGIISSVLACLYFGYSLVESGGFSIDPKLSLGRLIYWSIACPSIVLIMTKLKSSEIKENEVFLNSLFENLPNVIFVKDAKDLKFVRLNRAADKILGMKEEKLLGKTAYDFFPKEQADEFTNMDREILAAPTNIETRNTLIQTKLGLRRVRTTKLPIYDGEGNAKYLLGISEDITDLMQAREERDQFFDRSLDMLVVSGMDGFFKSVNPVVKKILGYTPDEFCARPYLEMIHPDDIQRTNDEVSKQKEGQEVFEFENRFQCKDGTYKWLSWKSAPVGDLMYACARDITAERAYKKEIEDLNRQLETRVKERTAELEKIAMKFERVNTSKMMGIMFWRADGGINEVNDTFLEVIGYSRKEFEEGKIDWRKLTPPESEEKDRMAMSEISERGICKPYEKEYFHKDGRRISILMGAAMIDSVKVEGICYVLDLTETKKKDLERNQMFLREQQAIAASQMKSSFLANMSHEIRTPINGVIGMTSLLLDSQLTTEQKEYSEMILSSADLLLTLVNDILDLSKAEAGKIKIEEIDFDLYQLIDDIERALALSFSTKGIKFIKLLFPNVPRSLKGDPTRLSQILVNLMSNAVKFTPVGSVALQVKLEGHDSGKMQLCFEIIDTGIGMSPESIDKIFQAFTQADDSTSRRFGGSGLGLSISKHLVSLMGGEIGARSKEGHGSTFWFKLRFKVGEHVMGLVTASQSEIPPATKKLRILLAEDNSVNKIIAMSMLSKLGYSAVAVANGLEAIEALRNAPYDLILMDCQMPELDGYETTERIRKGDVFGCRDIPIVALTAHAMKGDREKCLQAGMDDYLSKPVKNKDLAEAIERTYAACAAKRIG